MADMIKAGLRVKSQARRKTLSQTAAIGPVNARRRNDLLPKLEIVEREVAALRPPTRNVRPPDKAHIREVAKSIATLGFCVPVLIDGEDRVIDGWVRVEAARPAGLTRIPCISIGHLTPAEIRTLRLGLNRLGEKGRWDLDELRIELTELIVEDAPIEIAFSPVEIDQLIQDDEPQATETGPLEPDPELPAIARPGDLFQLGRHRVACGDAREENLLARLLGDDEVRLVLTDVPYNVRIQGHVTGGDHREFAMASGEMTPRQFEAFNATWMTNAGTYMVPGGVLATFIDWRGYPTVDRAAARSGLEPLNLVVWSKTNAGMGSLYRSAHELLPLYRKGSTAHVNNVELGKHGRWRSNVWTYPGASSMGSDAREGLKDHPTVKPTAMLEDAILDLTKRDEVVLDPFLGSGSTLIAAERTGRTCRGVELDPLYVDVILRRFEAETGQKPILVSDVAEQLAHA